MRRLLVLCVVGLAGCGGESSVQTVTVPAPSATRETADRSVELHAYLEEVAEIRDRYTHTTDRANAALDRVNTAGPDSSWTAAATELRDARDELDEISIDVESLAPPAELKVAYDALGKSLQLGSQGLDVVQSALAAKDVSRLIAAGEESKMLAARIRELRSTWRVDVTVRARQVGVVLPEWVRTVGKSRND